MVAELRDKPIHELMTSNASSRHYSDEVETFNYFVANLFQEDTKYQILSESAKIYRR